jgi:hypothetical protein
MHKKRLHLHFTILLFLILITILILWYEELKKCPLSVCDLALNTCVVL